MLDVLVCRDAAKNGTNKTGKSGIQVEELAALNENPLSPYDPHTHRNIEHPTT